MKITEVKTAEVRGHGYSLFVKVYTDEGLTGLTQIERFIPMETIEPILHGGTDGVGGRPHQ